MTVDVRLTGRLPRRVEHALAPHASAMYARPGSRWVALVEVEVHERTETTETNADGEPERTHTVRLRVADLEIATGDAAEYVREALRALWARRTASGTLDGALADAEADTAVRLLPGLLADDQ